jgi:hypothetical protein
MSAEEARNSRGTRTCRRSSLSGISKTPEKRPDMETPEYWHFTPMVLRMVDRHCG